VQRRKAIGEVRPSRAKDTKPGMFWAERLATWLACGASSTLSTRFQNMPVVGVKFHC
jgi:hypothetical protein